MNAVTNKILKSGKQDHVLYVDRRGIAAEVVPEVRAAAEAARVATLLSAASVPAECGSDIAAAPARGGFVLERIRHRDGMTREDFVETPAGYVRRSPIRRADVFDGMLAAAARAKRPSPLTPGQIAMGRRYHDLVQLLSADGTKLSQLQGGSGGGDAGEWMDRRLGLSAELEGICRRIGTGTAMTVRRVRPSERGEDQRGIILDRALVDMVCLRGCALADVLRAHGWSVKGAHREALSAALSAALDRMIGYRPTKSS